MTDDVDSRYRLSRVVVPSAYRLRLAPDLDALRFDGVVEIDVEVAEPTRAVVLNAVELEIHEVSASLSDGASRTATASLDESTDRATLTFVDELPAGSAVLRVTFTGVLNDRLVGFYRSTFTDVHGVERAIATSQLAATDARRAFPCFDEPAFKATFAVTLVVPQGLEAYSNAPVASESTLDDGRRELAFRPTMSMSTYLVAFVVGPFVASDVVDVDGVPLSVVCAPGKEHLTDFALDIGAFSLRFFADYFGIAYPGEKLDLVAIPDFAYGAMENLGCITFRETNLLIDPSSASTDELQQVAMVVAHEVA
ncbi:MAG TPA: M1 family metallopeptidase, partial [Acidimicrobiales bacterium]